MIARMQRIVSLPLADWSGASDRSLEDRAIDALEDGKVLYLPQLRFVLQPEEQGLLVPGCLAPGHKNVSYDPQTRGLRGTGYTGALQATLGGMMRRFGEAAMTLVHGLLPSYAPAVRQARVSYRPAEVDHRRLSPRKDDSRLHVDAFPSRPNRGERLLRVFTNVNPAGVARHWRVGEPFEDCARRFLPAIRPPLPGVHTLLAGLGITRGRRTLYDHYMLRLHDRMKADEAYQRDAPQQAFHFAAGSTWLVFSDQTVHAAMSGQYLLEQTAQLPVPAMKDPERAPLRVLERLQGRPLA